MPDNVIEMVPAYSQPSTNKLYVFGWPSHYGGADTKLDNTLRLVNSFMDITVIPNQDMQLNQKEWYDQYTAMGINCISRDEFNKLGDKLDGFALALSNGSFTSGITLCRIAKEKGLKVLWGNEMMWNFPGELSCIKSGYIDAVLYSSKFNREVLENSYNDARPGIENYVVDNYIDPTRYPYKQRNNSQFAIGRLSRADKEKYSLDFPVFYESLGLKNVKYRVMAWDSKLHSIYKWHSFGSEWEFLAQEQEKVTDFLYSLDLFVYKLGHTFRESWGRTTVEAMLTGCVPVVPTGHNFAEFILQGKTGFMCETFEDYRSVCQELQRNPGLRNTIGKQASAYAGSVICDSKKHEEIWRRVFNVW